MALAKRPAPGVRGRDVLDDRGCPVDTVHTPRRSRRARGSSTVRRPVDADRPYDGAASRPAAVAWRTDESASQLHRPGPAPRGAGPAAGAGVQPALVVGRPDPGPVPLGGPAALGAHLPRPGPPAQPREPPTARAAGSRRRRSWASSARCTPTCAATSRRRAGSRTARPARCAPWPTSRPSSASPRPCPQYSGGLGVLAGDHLKAASSLGRAAGRRRPALPARATSASTSTPTAGRRSATRSSTPTPWRSTLVRRAPGSPSTWPAQPSIAQVWLAQVGRVKLYLLDADVDENDDELRAVTDRLYGGGTEHRIRQEILLGIGGVRALDAARSRDRRCSTPTRATPGSSASSGSAG